jgi:hypothetical protein
MSISSAKLFPIAIQLQSSGRILLKKSEVLPTAAGRRRSSSEAGVKRMRRLTESDNSSARRRHLKDTSYPQSDMRSLEAKRCWIAASSGCCDSLMCHC